jgi:hypothetical protein
MFFNACIKAAEGQSQISADAVKIAEGSYSRDRLKAIADEWLADYPCFMDFVHLLKEKRSVIRVGELECEALSDLALRIASSDTSSTDDVTVLALRVALGDEPLQSLSRAVAAMLYKIGVVGVKLESFDAVQWSYTGERTVSVSEFEPDTRLHVHPAFWRCLGSNSKA